MMRISREQGINLCLNKQLLIGHTPRPGKASALEIIKRLGYLQIDTINVIERSHHLVLYSRISDYKQRYLHELQAKDKKIFEYWAHAASFIPMKDYRYYLRAIEKRPKKGSWLEKWIRDNRSIIKKVRERVTKEGPLAASNFADTKDRKRGTWWDWKPAKMALEVLFWQGVLMIKERKNFQRVYDLTERVLPKNLNIQKPGIDQEKRFFIKRALQALGVATQKDINSYIGVSGKLNDWIAEMIKSGEIRAVEITGIKKPYLILAHDLAEIGKPKPASGPEVCLLSPFDNSIILRDRTRDLFEFDYCLECYTPREKRKYGYFCLPILWQNQLVGRIDPKADRQRNVMIVNSLHLEMKKIESRVFFPSLARTLVDFARFHDCRDIEFARTISKEVIRAMGRFF